MWRCFEKFIISIKVLLTYQLRLNFLALILDDVEVISKSTVFFIDLHLLVLSKLSKWTLQESYDTANFQWIDGIFECISHEIELSYDGFELINAESIGIDINFLWISFLFLIEEWVSDEVSHRQLLSADCEQAREYPHNVDQHMVVFGTA